MACRRTNAPFSRRIQCGGRRETIAEPRFLGAAIDLHWDAILFSYAGCCGHVLLSDNDLFVVLRQRSPIMTVVAQNDEHAELPMVQRLRESLWNEDRQYNA